MTGAHQARLAAVLAGGLAFGVTACSQTGPIPAAASSVSSTMPPFKHPGEVRMVDMFTHEVKIVPATDVPEGQRFVYYKDDLELTSPDGATRAVPVVEMRMFSLDGAGHLVPKAQASRLRILEIGPDGDTLRTTLLVPGAKR
ncbi:MAG: hypothetical protein ABJD97_04110 [Betaproteobacteria bacterium]